MRLKERTAQLKQYCSEHDLTYMNERTSVLGYGHSEASKVTAAYRKALAEETKKLDKLMNSVIIGLTTSNGITITELSDHLIERIDTRELDAEGIKDALLKPLHTGDTVIDSKGRPSQRFIGRTITVNVNPETGVIPTAWKTGRDKIKKYLKE